MTRSTTRAALVLLLAGLASAAWYFLAPNGNAPAPGAARSRAEAPVTVTTVTARQENFALRLAANGTVSALNRVEIHPQVSAAIVQVHVAEGQPVKAGQLLFTLDSRAAAVRVTQAQAELQRNLATLADAERQLQRSRDLLRQEFVSQSAVDTNLSLAEAQRALVAANRAAIRAAQVELSYSRITAPSAGRAGAIGVYAGSYVTPASPPLVTVTQLDPIAVSFEVPQRHLGDLLASLRSGAGRVTAQLPHGPGGGTTLEGTLQFVDSAVDAASGAVQAKAQFANPEQLLWPGAYVNVAMDVRTLPDAILVPQAAIIQGAREKTVYVVGPDGKAVLRPIELTASAGETAVVTGVRAGERIVVEGKQNLRPGSTVVEQSRPGDAVPVASAASAAAREPTP
jgi:RND family efflux transporter MFP subunit